MDIRNRRAIHRAAGEAIAAAPSDPKKIALVYTLICSVMALASTVLTGVLTDRIADTGGLANMGLRSILSTGQTILPFVQLIVTACLGLGYQFAVLRIARGEHAEPRTLLEGFRNFGPLFRAMLLQAMLYISFGIITMYLSTSVFLATPMAEPFYEIMDPIVESASMLSAELMVDEATMIAAGETLMPMLWIWGGMFLILFLPAYYSYRMTNFCLADDPRQGALRAMHSSKMMMRRNRIALLKLDVSMWWFYGLQILVTVVCYGDVLLPMMGVELPWSGTFSYYFFFVLSLALQLVTYYFLMNRVNVAYAVAFDALHQPEAPVETPQKEYPFSTEY